MPPVPAAAGGSGQRRPVGEDLFSGDVQHSAPKMVGGVADLASGLRVPP